MNSLPRPLHDDHTLIENLANNQLVGSFPLLQAVVPTLQAAYAQYLVANGNVHAIQPVAIDAVVADHLKKHYKKPPRGLAHINTMRTEHEHRTCPMCGSSHRGQLDHVLPKENYAAFTVFSANLVPACKCNTLRRTDVAGNAPDERVLHPYFDQCMATRLLAADFVDLGPVPRVVLRILPDANHPQYAAIMFHVNTVIERTAVKAYLLDRWITLCRKPSLAVRALEANPISEAGLRQLLESELDQLDDVSGSKNNWNSLFVAGLLEANTLRWLYQQLNMPGRPANTALLP